jgi:hypothetical protein
VQENVYSPFVYLNIFVDQLRINIPKWITCMTTLSCNNLRPSFLHQPSREKEERCRDRHPDSQRVEVAVAAISHKIDVCKGGKLTTSVNPAAKKPQPVSISKDLLFLGWRRL